MNAPAEYPDLFRQRLCDQPMPRRPHGIFWRRCQAVVVIEGVGGDMELCNCGANRNKVRDLVGQWMDRNERFRDRDKKASATGGAR